MRRYPIKSDNVIAHIRKATQGRVALENTHPFVRELWGRYWVFAHNGDLKDFQPRLHGAFRPVGDTDSERAFCWLMQELAKAHASVPAIAELTRTLRELVPLLAAHGTFNLLLSNGQALWAHGSTRLHWLVRQHPFARATLADDDLSVDFAERDHAERPRGRRRHRAADRRRDLDARSRPASCVSSSTVPPSRTPLTCGACRHTRRHGRPPVPRFDHFYRHDELTRLLPTTPTRGPTWCACDSIGKSHEGRDIWLAALTNTATGADTDKPAFWVDGNIHAAELTASTACLY